MSSHCYINEDFDEEVKRARKAIDSLKDVIEALKCELENRTANGEDVDTEELDCYEEAIKRLVWREYEANDLLVREEGSRKTPTEWYDQDEEQSNINYLEELEKRIMQLEILNAEIEAHHARFSSGEADKCEMELLTNRALIIQDEMRCIDSRISDLLNYIPDDPQKADLLKKYDDFWAVYKHKLKLEVN